MTHALKNCSLPSGLPMRYQDLGRGEPLLFVHGFPLDHSMWRHQAESLSDSHRVIVPDLRGFGQTPPIAGVASMAALADDLSALLEELEIPRIVFVGLSMGGYIAWQFWARHSHQLRGLILCDTRAAADSIETANGRRVMADRVQKEGCGFLAELMVPRLFANASLARDPAMVDSVRSVIGTSNTAGVTSALIGMAERPDMTSHLSAIDVPSLLICGESDVISPSAEMRSIAAAMPRAQFVEIRDAGHMAPLENPAPVNAAIRQFVDTLP